MPPPPKKKRACRENAKLAKDAILEKNKERNNDILLKNEEQSATINSILVTIAMIRSDFAGINSTVTSLKLEKNELKQKNEIIEVKISKVKAENELLKKQKEFMKKEDQRRMGQLDKQKKELAEAQESNRNLITESPTSGRSIFAFHDLKDRKSKNERCMMVVKSIKQIIKSDSVDRFLSYFFTFVNDSSLFSTRYQLTDEETFYCKVRFHLSDTFFRLFKKFYNAVTGFDVFSSRHDIANIGRRVSVAQFYEVSTHSIQKKTLSGSISLVKRPLVRITSLEDVLSYRLSTLAQNSRLLFDRSTGDDISIILSGDKGGEETKIVLILENTEKPNSSKSQLILGFYTGDDDFDQLKEHMETVFNQFNNLNLISYNDGNATVTKKVKRKIVGDVKILCCFYNHKGAGLLDCCFICFIEYSNRGVNMAQCGSFPFDQIHGLRTMESYRRSGHPLVNLDPKLAIIPPLHCFQGITQKYGLDHLTALAKSIDLKKFNFPENIAAQKKRLSELEFEEQLYVRKIKNLCEELEKLNDIKTAFEKYEKKASKIDSKHRCSSSVCISKELGKKRFNSESYQCLNCQKLYHYQCNAIVSLSEKTEARVSKSSTYCFECSGTGNVRERKKVVEEKIVNTQLTMDSEESAWEDVYEERKEIKKVLSGLGDADSLTKKLDEKMKRIGCINYDCSKNLTGNQTRKFLRKDNIDEVVNIFPSSPELENVRNFLHSLARLMSHANSEVKNDEQLNEICEELKVMIDSIRLAHPEKNVTVKLHLVAAHLIDLLKDCYSWGKVCEQGVEHLHSDFKKLHLTFAAVMDPIAKGHAFLSALTNENYLSDRGEAWNV
ncbi:hypothetical protein CAEBREN_00047 [Caenorhabditis brenneri]|uniref:Zinc finger PHD-type domain-containing protein n=1 Tax=Caenorhabditis brenneri TaxID=135651 RepID=G0P988_CAEBE|nr:hypothetical protein CAEBREN_00047 [Caenorhabditis brenneri]